MSDVKLYRVKEIQHILGICKNTAYALCSSGAIKTIRVGSSIRVTQEALDEYLNRKGEVNG